MSVDNLLVLPAPFPCLAGAVNISTFKGYLDEANITKSVGDMLNLTLFAPSNAAFEAAMSAVQPLSGASLEKLLSHHIELDGQVHYIVDLASPGMTLRMRSGLGATVAEKNDQVFMAKARLVWSDYIV